jgi:hypothetical protein
MAETSKLKNWIVGIDIDGTVTAAPDYFASLANKIRSDGGQVHIVSSRSPTSYLETSQELNTYGLKYDALYLLPNFGSKLIEGPSELGWYEKYLWQKTSYALRNNLTHFFDDDLRVLELFKSYSPNVILNIDWHN